MKKTFSLVTILFLLTLNGCIKPCTRKFPPQEQEAWDRICSRGPAIENTIISKEMIADLKKVGFFCSGCPFPHAKEINNICQDIAKKGPSNRVSTKNKLSIKARLVLAPPISSDKRNRKLRGHR